MCLREFLRPAFLYQCLNFFRYILREITCCLTGALWHLSGINPLDNVSYLTEENQGAIMSDRPVFLTFWMICDYSSISELIDSEPLHLSNPFWTVEYNEAEYSVFPSKSILNNTPGVLLQFHVCILSQSRTHSGATVRVPFAPSLFITTAFQTRWCFASMQVAGTPM